MIARPIKIPAELLKPNKDIEVIKDKEINEQAIRLDLLYKSSLLGVDKTRIF